MGLLSKTLNGGTFLSLRHGLDHSVRCGRPVSESRYRSSLLTEQCSIPHEAARFQDDYARVATELPVVADAVVVRLEERGFAVQTEDLCRGPSLDAGAD